MIDPKELRIGNYVNNEGVVVKADAKTIFDLAYYENLHGEKYNPIQITPEWLERLGFENHITQRWRKELLVIEYAKDDSLAFGFFGRRTQSNYFIVDRIHQLQNLYFALTGEELTIKA